MSKLTVVDIVALVLVVIGGLNWGLMSISASWNVVAMLGDALARIVYALVGLAAIYVAVISVKLERK